MHLFRKQCNTTDKMWCGFLELCIIWDYVERKIPTLMQKQGTSTTPYSTKALNYPSVISIFHHFIPRPSNCEKANCCHKWSFRKEPTLKAREDHRLKLRAGNFDLSKIHSHALCCGKWLYTMYIILVMRVVNQISQNVIIGLNKY